MNETVEDKFNTMVASLCNTTGRNDMLLLFIVDKTDFFETGDIHYIVGMNN